MGVVVVFEVGLMMVCGDEDILYCVVEGGVVDFVVL